MAPALLRQEGGIEHLGQIFRAGIADQADDPLRRRLGAAIAQRRRQQRARGGAGEHALGAQQFARGGEALGVGNREGLGDQREIGIRRHEVLADAFDRPASRLRHSAGLDIGRKHRALGIGEDHRGLGRRLPHEPADAGQRAAGADADHDGVDVAVHLAQDFRAGRRLVRPRIGRIGELVDEDRAGRAARDRLGHVLIVVGMALADVRARGDDLGAHGLGVQHLLPRHLVGHDQQRAIALAAAHQGEPEPGIAGRRLDDRAAGLELAVGLRRLDHRARRPVLERAGRVRALELEKEPAGTAIDAGDLDERRVADEVEDRCHGDL